MATIIEDRLHLLGGEVGESTAPRVDRISSFDGRNTNIAPMKHERKRASIFVIANCIRVYRGRQNEEFINSSEIYDVRLDMCVVLVAYTKFCECIYVQN